jgi:hypothetical protein
MRIFRFKHLKAAGIFNDRMALRRAILRGDLEAGLEMAPNTLGWTDEMIERYVQSRPRRVPGSGRRVPPKKIGPAPEAMAGCLPLAVEIAAAAERAKNHPPVSRRQNAMKAAAPVPASAANHAANYGRPEPLKPKD